MECLVNSSTRWKTPVKLLHKSSYTKNQFVYDEVAVYFSKEEWDCLTEEEKELYKNVMMENYQNLKYIGCVNIKPMVISYIEEGEEPYMRDYIQSNENKFAIDSRTRFLKKARGHRVAQPGKSVRFTSEENTVLVTKVIQHYNSITGVATAKESSKKKAIWKMIVDAVNAVGGNLRSMKVCKKRYHDIKRHLKKKLSRAAKSSEEFDVELNPYEEELRKVLGSKIILCVNGDIDTDKCTASKQKKLNLHPKAAVPLAPETSEESSDSLPLQGSNAFHQLDMSYSSEGSDILQDHVTEHKTRKLLVFDKPSVSTPSSKQKTPLHHSAVPVWASEESLDSFNLQGSNYFQQQESTSEGSDLSLDLFTELETYKLQVTGSTTGTRIPSVSGNSVTQEQHKVIGPFAKPADLRSTTSGPSLPNLHSIGNMKVPAAVLLEKSVQQIQLLLKQISSQGDSKSTHHDEYIKALNELRREIKIFNFDRELYETRIFRSQLLQLKREKLTLQRERLELLKHKLAMHQHIETSSEEE